MAKDKSKFDRLRVKVFISLQRTQKTGYRVADDKLASTLSGVVDYITSFDDGTSDAMAALFDALCELRPADAVGQGYKAQLDRWRSIILSEASAPQSVHGMTQEDLMAMIAERASEQGDDDAEGEETKEDQTPTISPDEVIASMVTPAAS